MADAPLELIDIGANLTHASFRADLADVIARAAAAGVGRLIVTGGDLQSSRDALRLADQYAGTLFATAGVHPHHALEFEPATDAQLMELAGSTGVVAVGECGLDYFRNYSPPAAQREAFSRQLRIAVDLGKPLFLHQRDAHADFVAMLREYLPNARGGVAHCFTGTQQEMESYLALGLHIGVTGWICDERRGDALRAAVRHLPPDRLLFETDAPYLLPRDLSPKPANRRNEPAVLPHVLRATARCMESTAEALAATSTRNAIRLFALPG